MRKRKVQQLVIPRYNGRKERRVPMITLSGKWIGELGIQEGAELYVYERQGEITLSIFPPQPIQLTPLEVIKFTYKELGISTTR